MPKSTPPEALVDAVKYFADEDVALAFVANVRWPHGPMCPRCDSRKISFLKTRRLWKCRRCQKQFSVKVGTIFEDSPVSLSKWLPVLWISLQRRSHVSSYTLARALGVTQKTAWFMLHRVRLAMRAPSFVHLKSQLQGAQPAAGHAARSVPEDMWDRTGGPWRGKVTGVALAGRQGDKDPTALSRTGTGDKRSPEHAEVKEHMKLAALLDQRPQAIRVQSFRPRRAARER